MLLVTIIYYSHHIGFLQDAFLNLQYCCGYFWAQQLHQDVLSTSLKMVKLHLVHLTSSVLSTPQGKHWRQFSSGNTLKRTLLNALSDEAAALCCVVWRTSAAGIYRYRYLIIKYHAYLVGFTPTQNFVPGISTRRRCVEKCKRIYPNTSTCVRDLAGLNTGWSRDSQTDLSQLILPRTKIKHHVYANRGRRYWLHNYTFHLGDQHPWFQWLYN